MLDKKVVKFSRDGICQKNISTGSSQMLTTSEYSKKIKYEKNTQNSYSKDKNIYDKSKNLNYKTRKSFINNHLSGFKREINLIQNNKIKTTFNFKARIFNKLKYGTKSAINKGVDKLDSYDQQGLKVITQSFRTIKTSKKIFQKSRSIKRFFKKNKSESINRKKWTQKTAKSKRIIQRRLRQQAMRKANTKIGGLVAKKIGAFVVKILGAKGILIVGGILIAIIFLLTTIPMMISSIFGSGDPELTNPQVNTYVAQLNSNFLEKLEKIKSEKIESKEYNQAEITNQQGLERNLQNIGLLVFVRFEEHFDDTVKLQIDKWYNVLTSYEFIEQEETAQAEDGQEVTVKNLILKVNVFDIKIKIDELELTPVEIQDIEQFLEILSDINNNGTGEFLYPLPPQYNVLSSDYGRRDDPFNPDLAEFHTGLDIPAPYGTDVYAASDGKVVVSGVNGGYGNCVIIEHSAGLQTLYGHNSELTVKVGDTVKKGDVIAKVGSTGNSTGNHVHFEVRVNGKHTDPKTYLQGDD